MTPEAIQCHTGLKSN